MIRAATSKDVEIVNAIFNAPEVMEWSYMDRSKTYDMSSILDNVKYIVLVNETNNAMTIWEDHNDGKCEGHSMFMNSCRGKLAIETGKQMIRFMKDLGFKELLGRTPINNKAARRFSRMIGFKSDGLTQVPGVGICELFEYKF